MNIDEARAVDPEKVKKCCQDDFAAKGVQFESKDFEGLDPSPKGLDPFCAKIEAKIAKDQCKEIITKCALKSSF